MALPRDILDCVDRVYAYHAASKHSYQSVRLNGRALDWASQPSPYRTFRSSPRVPLPTDLVHPDADTLAVLRSGRAASTTDRPPRDVRTLASWLFLANGRTVEKRAGRFRYWLRSCPSSGALYPYEIYIAAFAVDGLTPGLYHYNARDFDLGRLRGGEEVLGHFAATLPDPALLAEMPAVLLVSTNYWRSAWKYQRRAYRYVLQDAGHLIENLVRAGEALGVATLPQLQLAEKFTRELIGVPRHVGFGEAESVQGTVIWLDHVPQPPSPPAPPPALPSIARRPLSRQVTPYASILAAHDDCVRVAPASPEIGPPLTELLAIPPDAPREPATASPLSGRPIGDVLCTRRSARDFVREPLPRDSFLAIARAGFGQSSYFPIAPPGSYAGLLRAFWIVHAVDGMQSGVWYQHPPGDEWALLRAGEFREQARYLSLEQPLCGNGAAVCFMVANLHALMTGYGPDAYRLAHLEAGIVGQRIYLASAALNVGCSGIGAFYDDDVRKFLGLETSGWEVIYEIALGVAEHQGQPQQHDETRPAGEEPPPSLENAAGST